VLHSLDHCILLCCAASLLHHVQFFYDKELTFALGVTVAVACFAKTLAKASVAPIAEAFGGYMTSLWFAAGMLVSVVSYCDDNTSSSIYKTVLLIAAVSSVYTDNSNIEDTTLALDNLQHMLHNSSYTLFYITAVDTSRMHAYALAATVGP
jgi:hypothetical protein